MSLVIQRPQRSTATSHGSSRYYVRLTNSLGGHQPILGSFDTEQEAIAFRDNYTGGSKRRPSKKSISAWAKQVQARSERNAKGRKAKPSTRRDPGQSSVPHKPIPKSAIPQLERMGEAWNGNCDFCGKPVRGKKATDHCHLTGMLRGLVHERCNRVHIPFLEKKRDSGREITFEDENYLLGGQANVGR